jgi:hypothetical protein
MPLSGPRRRETKMLPNFNVVIGGIIISIALLAATGASLIKPQSYTRIGETPEISRPVVQRMIADAESAARFHLLTVARRNEELGRLRELVTPEGAAELHGATGRGEPAGTGYIFSASPASAAAAASGAGAQVLADVAAAGATSVPALPVLPSDAAGSRVAPPVAPEAAVAPLRRSAAADEPNDHESTAALGAVPTEEARPGGEIPAEDSLAIVIAASPPHIRRFLARAVRAAATTHKPSFRHLHRGMSRSAPGGYGFDGNNSDRYNFSDYDHNGYLLRGSRSTRRRSDRYNFARYDFERYWRSSATSR